MEDHIEVFAMDPVQVMGNSGDPAMTELASTVTGKLQKILDSLTA
jgi:hypothetical protein